MQIRNALLNGPLGFGAAPLGNMFRKILDEHNRNEYVLSSKVGRLILDEVVAGKRDFGEKTGLFEFGRPSRIVYDYSAEGTIRSIEGSLDRLGVDRLDFVWVHDVS